MSNLGKLTGWVSSSRSQHRRLRGLESRDLRPLVGADGVLGASADGLVAAMPVQLGRLTTIYLRGQQVLDGPDLAYLMTSVEDAVHSAAAASRRQPRNARPSPAVAAALTSRVDEMASYLTRREGEISRRRYAQDLSHGVLLSLLLLTGLGLLGYAVIKTWVWMQGGQRFLATTVPAYDLLALRDALVTIGGGAAGAAVSVLLRLSRSTSLTVETINSGAARYRLVLGWFFAAAFLFLVKGGIAANLINDPSAALLTDSTPEVIVSSWFFWGGVGFLAGFNERWATHIISRDPNAAVDVPVPAAPPTPVTETPVTETPATGSPATGSSGTVTPATETPATGSVQYVMPPPTVITNGAAPRPTGTKKAKTNGHQADPPAVRSPQG